MIRWIKDYMGTAPRESIIPDDKIEIIDVRDMVDKPGNSVEMVKEKIESALNHLKRGKKVVICCDYGISRSNAIAVGILKKQENVSFEDAVEEVVRTTGEKAIKIEVLNIVRKAVEEFPIQSSVPNKNILITGASGFIGKKLTERFAGIYSVYAPKREEINVLEGTLALDSFVKKHAIGTIIHLANPRIYTSNDAMGLTLVMLKNVLDVCRENSLKIVYPSSWEIYSGYKASFLLADEYLPPNPKGAYGETKYFAEQLLDFYKRHYGVDHLILRISQVYGGGEKPKFIYNFIRKALHDETIITHKYLNGSPVLDFVYVDDVVKAFEKAMERNISGVINIGSGIGLSTLDVARAIVRIAGSTKDVGYSLIDSHSPNIVMDIEKAKSVLSWEPLVAISGWLESYITDLERGK